MKRPGASLTVRGRGSWATHDALVAEVAGGARPYLWIGAEDALTGQVTFVTVMTAAQAARLVRFLDEHFAVGPLGSGHQ